MEMTDASKRVKELREQISHHDYLYYVCAKPEIGDREYDMLLKELAELEAAHPDLVTPDSPTQRVSGQPIEGFARVEHSTRMLSIENVYEHEKEKLRKFDEDVRQAAGREGVFHYLVDPKVDGVAVSLRYQGGQLVRAATRGDGFVGDDITANAKAIGAIPLSLRGEGWPDVLEVRGEVYWPLNAFSRFNARLTAQKKELFRNSRNGTTGTLKQLDPRVVRQRGLSFMAQARPVGHPTQRSSQSVRRHEASAGRNRGVGDPAGQCGL
jgi:DNA ligase (NAD+)